MLWVAQTAQQFSIRPSTLLHLECSEQVALDFDLACSYALTRHENKRDNKRLDLMIKSISAIMIASQGGDVSELLAGEDENP